MTKMTKTPNEIKEFYASLEVLESLDYWEISKNLKPLEEYYEHEWRKKLATEQLCFRFHLEEGQLKSNFPNIDREGKEFRVPDFSFFDKDRIEYLKLRIKETKNTLLLARYNHILFEINKNQTYAKEAIKSYRNIVTQTIEEEKQLIITSIFPVILTLTQKIKYNIEEIKEYSFCLLNNNKIKLWVKNSILSELIKSSLIKSYELKNLPHIILQWIKKEKESNYDLVKNLLEQSVKLCIENNLDTSSFYEKLGENAELLLVEHQEDEDFLRPIIIGEQMNYYKKAKNLKKFEEKQKEYTEAKSKIKLNFIECPLGKELQHILNENIKQNVDKMLKWETDRIFNYFSNHNPLFPNIKDTITKAIKKYDKSFLKHVTNNLFDLNINAKQLSPEEEKEHKIYEEYKISLTIGALTQFTQIIHFGVINNKINYAKLYTYLENNSWFGQNIFKPKMRSKEESETYNWLNFMAPALHSLFMQLEQSFLIGIGSPYTNYILAIDSLTLKFEGALRDFVRLLEGSVYSFKDGNIQEMLLESLLETDVVKREFHENDIALFKMTFTKKGENIRNNIAHCFYLADDYSVEKACRILFCILRLGKYKLTTKNKNP